MTTTLAEIKRNGKCALEYNRAGREWLLGYPSGQIISFPAGHEGKKAAQMAALHSDAPEAAAEIEALMAAHPLESVHLRLIRAGFLLRDGHLVELHVKENFIGARVLSSRKEKQYQVHYNLAWHCTCQDWEDGNAYRMGYARKTWAPVVRGQGVMCKHAWAVWIAARLRPAMATCPECNGDGFHLHYVDVGRFFREECELCSGSGEVPADWVEPLMIEYAPIPPESWQPPQPRRSKEERDALRRFAVENELT